jgi:hypothetical protein
MNDKMTKAEELLKDVEWISPYKLASIVSSVVGKHVREQMIYNYCKKGYIKSSRNDLQKLQISKNDALKFVEKYDVKSENRVSKYA